MIGSDGRKVFREKTGQADGTALAPDAAPVYQENVTAFDFSENRIRMERAAQISAFNFYNSIASWRHMVTLTFTKEVGPDPAMAKWNFLVKALNKNLYGNHYTRVVGHSYFTFLMGIEFQRRGVEHFHVLVDKPIDYTRIHSIWNAIAGWAWIDQIREKSDALNYVTKYVLKGGEVIPFRSAENLPKPSSLPIWWQ